MRASVSGRHTGCLAGVAANVTVDPATPRPRTRPRVVIIGSGFGGLFAARALKRTDVDVTVLAKTSHQVFARLALERVGDDLPLRLSRPVPSTD